MDRAIQASTWRAFIDATLDEQYGVGKALYGMLGWRLWPGSTNDDGATGFSVQNKPAAAAIEERWSRASGARRWTVRHFGASIARALLNAKIIDAAMQLEEQARNTFAKRYCRMKQMEEDDLSCMRSKPVFVHTF